MQIANRVLQLKPSATLAVNTLAQELRATGREVISLSVGEPDFDTPRHIRDAAIAAVNAGFTKYTAVPGIPELRKAASDYFNLAGAGSLPEHVLISNGGKQSLYNLFQCVLNPGDEVIIPAPYWVSYPPMVELAGGIAVIAHSGVEKGFKITPGDLERLRTPKTKACVINSPSNPTGAIYSQAELDAIAAWAVENKILIISDEIYDRLVYHPSTHASACPWWHKHPENFVIVNGVAKTFAMTGWRVGYLLAHPEIIKACNKLQGQSTSNICSIAQAAALAALTGSLDCLPPMRDTFMRRRDLVMEAIGRWPGVTCATPGGAFYVFPDVRELFTSSMPNSTALCKTLLDKAGVALVPGEAFGDDNCIRISYATDDATLQKALEKIESALW
ncbi:MAG: pyridoxal phosphate-dependent aminotransferase [Deltaproteobacteria bacterium]|jgi:aspartate aminotransferase|nr:pyridoxal phosphate-dependent aminotransferase [Deltaproteobacteria bacterium]